MKHKLLFFLTIAFLTATPLFAQSEWPKNISTSDGGKLTMYEPQPESLNGNQLTARAAVSVRKSENDEPLFGVIFFTATVQNSGRSGNEITSLRVTQAKFPGVDDENLVDKYSSLLEKNSSGWNLGMTDNELREAVDREKISSRTDFNNAAPKIIYTTRPSTLIVLDGEPKVLYDKNIDADKIVNSPNLIFREGNHWNLYAGGNWYSSFSVMGPWKSSKRMSSKVKKVNEAIKKQEKENNNGEEISATPRLTEIIVTTTPTELLQTDGEPEYKTVAGTSLLYVSNSPNEIFKDVNSQKTYILIAGRWYNSPDMNGPWTYVPADRLPEDFAMIPEGSDKDKVLSNVAGTEAAEDARINAAVPQTARVDKRTATIHVEYDGTPVFNQIEGTSIDLAENANVTVMIDAEGRYFAQENGIWFVGNSAYGPWKVANDRPKDIEDIPASSRAYNTKYVYIYDETPEYVYMGYTSGYLGSYYYGPTMVYGTGWHYRPWYRSVYYPRPITWGFGFMYDPWIGWNINWGYNFGFMYIGFNYGRFGYDRYGYGYGYGGGWFGPQYYCPPYRRSHYGGYYGRYNDYYVYNDSYRNGYGYNSGAGRNVTGNGSRPNRRPDATTPNQPGAGSGSGWNRNYNLYNNQRGVVTQNVNRSPRVYRPDGLANTNVNVNSPVNSRYSNRLSPDNNNSRTPQIRNSNSNNSTVTPGNERIRNPRMENPREPVINRSEQREPVINRTDPREPVINRTDPREPVINRNEQREPVINRNDPREPVINRNEQREPVINRNEQREPVINRPEQREPIINRSDNRNNNGGLERNNRQPRVNEPGDEPVRERPSVSRPVPVERERPAQVERPERVQRSLPERQERTAPARVERPDNGHRQQDPLQRESPRQQSVERPSFNRPSPPQQSNRSSGSSGSSGGLQRGRPDRR